MWPLLSRAAPYLFCAVLLAYGGYWCYSTGAAGERTEWQAKWSQRDTDDAIAGAAAELTQRTEEQRRADWAAGVQRDATQALEKVRTDADGALADAQRLRDELAKLQARLSGTGKNTGAPVSSASATRAAMVLSELYGSCQSRLTELSSAFDRARIAGLACESAYGGLKPRN